MEKYVTSRELSERLKAAGFPQETQYRYYIGDGYDGKLLNEHDWDQHFADEAIREGEIVAAPLSDELLEQLPPKMARPDGVDTYLSILPAGSGGWVVCYEPIKADVFGRQLASGLADALAQLWLYCKEYGLLSPNTEKNDE